MGSRLNVILIVYLNTAGNKITFIFFVFFMFMPAIVIGIYSYIIFGLGLLGILYKGYLTLATLVFVSAVFYFYKNKLKVPKLNSVFIKRDLLFAIGLLVLVLPGIINLIGVLGPELGFDALWYHLTIPKIFLQNHSIFYIPGGLFYYSAMPKLTEMLYVAGLTFGNEIAAKLIHFFFGILSLVALYNLSRKFLPRTFSLLAIVLFYSNLVVGWMSITAYIDLARTFFEIMALWGFINWIEKKNRKWLITSAILLGLAISAKLLALSTLLIFAILIIIFTRKITNALAYCFFALLVPLPWFVSSYIYTGNPIYPFFTNIYPVKFNFSLINPLNLSDPISPLYIIFLPLAAFLYRKFKLSLRVMSLYSFFAIAVWYLTPQTGGGRFILPYLPAFSLVTIAIVSMIKQIKLRNTFIGLIIVLALFSIFYRGAANFKYISVVLGKESTSQFLSNHLNFSFGDFYDTDGYFAKQIKQEDKALLYGFHNLYYVNFPFIDSSYIKKGDKFNYVGVYGNNLPPRFKFWNLIYYNEKTNVRLYSIGGLMWAY